MADRVALDFLQESQSVLDDVENSILNLSEAENGDARHNAIDDIFRKVHSIKGNSGFFNMEALNSFAHKMENIFSKIRDGMLDVNQDNTDLLLKGIDALKNIVDRLLQSPDDVISLLDDERELLAVLENLQPSYGKEVLEELCSRFMTAINKQIESGGLEESFHQISTILEAIETNKNLNFLSKIVVSQELEDQQGMLEGELIRVWAHLLHTITPEGIPEDTQDWINSIHDTLPDIVPKEAEFKLREMVQFWQFVNDEFLGFQPELLEEYIIRARDFMTHAFGEDLWTCEDAQGDDSSPGQDVRSAGQADTRSKIVQIDQDKLDFFMAEVGELIMSKNVFDYVLENAISRGIDRQISQELRAAIDLMDIHTTELHRQLMEVRKIPLGTAFKKFRRVVRDLAANLGKDIDFVIQGTTVEIDRSNVEKLHDPLVHMLRNSIDHGIEATKEDRQAVGKADTGQITLSATQVGEFVEISLSDDGRGINLDKVKAKALERGLTSPTELDSLSDDDIAQFIFKAGFSTADKVTDVSGRGVGMDVVKTAIKEIGGSLKVHTEVGQGSTFLIKIPIAETLVTKIGLLVGVAKEKFFITLDDIMEIASVPIDTIQCSQNGAFLKHRQSLYGMLKMSDILGLASPTPGATAVLVFIHNDDQECALMVDKVYGNQKVVIRDLQHDCLSASKLFSGTAILGDGRAIMVLDVKNIMKHNLSVQEYAAQG